MALARALGHLIQFLKDHDVADRIAYTELHNEVEYSKLTAIAQPDEDPYAAMKPFIEEAVGDLRAQHPDILITACYARPTVYRLRDLAANLQVAHIHLYIYGVLEELFQAVGLRGSEPFPNEATRAILRPGAPPFAAWTPPAGQEWRLQATGINRRLFYVHDWADPDKWDLWLYERYGAYREAMRQDIQQRLAALADWAGQHGIPAVIGEGYVGYTPLLATFEEGPVGKDIAEYAIDTCLRLNVWGVILCSNAAPHHPFWQDVVWQQTWNRRIMEA
jgi:hypothetical protein